MGSDDGTPPDEGSGTRESLARGTLIRVPVTRADRFWVICAFLPLVLDAILIQAAWATLPESIPTHFGLLGEADRWGSRYKIFLLPAISLGLNAICLGVAGKVWLHNVPWKVTPANAVAIFTLSRRLLLQLPAVIGAFLTWSIWRTLLTAHGSATGVGPYYLPAFVGTMAVVVGTFYFRGQRAAAIGAGSR